MGLFNETNTSTALGNTGLQNFPGNVGKWKHLVFVPKGEAIATKVLALTKSTWTNGINAAVASRYFVSPLIFNGEPTQEDPVREDSDFGYSTFVRDGKLTYLITFEEMSVYNKTQLNKLNNGDFDIFVITDKDYKLGYTNDATMFLPYDIDYHRILPETQNTGSANAHVQMELRFSEVNQMNLKQVALNPTTDPDAPAVWYPSIELPAAAIKDLVAVITSMTATSTLFTLKGYDNVLYEGAVAADVYLRKTTQTGAAITISELVYASGVYTATHAAQTSGTFYLSLYDQPTATTEGFETPVVSSYAATISS